MTGTAAPSLRYGSNAARWVLVATVLGSGMAFLDGTVVNVALPAISTDLGTSFSGLQWTVNAYLITLSALLLLGGSLGDRLGRRTMYIAGLVAFTGASVLCGLAPSSAFLVVARAVQGVGGALLVPGSLAIIAATFHPDDRGRAIGAWSGLAGVASAIGPFLGGWLIDAVSWRLVFLINVPLAAAAIAVTVRHVPETRAPIHGRLDVAGAGLVTIALAGISYATIEHRGTTALVAAAAGVVALASFLGVERSSPHPMLPLRLFRSPQFTGTNLTTLAVYAGLSVSLFFVVLQLQTSLGYSALEAGAALLPFTVIMLLLSPTAGRLGQRLGARLPLTIGPIVASIGILLLGAVNGGDRYLAAVLPGVAVLGLGMAVTVAPLTAAVFGSVDDDEAGVASGVNNAVARLAGLLAVAALPALASVATNGSVADSLHRGYAAVLHLGAATTALGGLIAALLVGRTASVRASAHPCPLHACNHPALLTAPGSPAGDRP